jgi:hypothetical protein
MKNIMGENFEFLTDSSILVEVAEIKLKDEQKVIDEEYTLIQNQLKEIKK